MLTRADEIKADIARTRAEIDRADSDIEQRKARLHLLESYRSKKVKLLAVLEGALEREEAPRAQPVGPCVELEAHDGVVWKL